MYHQILNIGGKDVYVVEAHHEILQSWAHIRRSQAAAPALLTLDHHTDTYEAFFRHRYHATHKAVTDENQAAMAALLPGMIAAMRWDDEDSVLDAISKLHHDEHIRTAILAGIVSRAFVVNLSDENSSEPGVLYSTSAICAIGCEKESHNDDCAPIHAGQVLESIYLNYELDELNAMAQANGLPTVEAGPYILDIDLDYFHTDKAIDPVDPAAFYRLVQNAVAVSIATEPSCVKELRHEGSTITARSLLDRMKQHIATAMT